MMNSTNNPGSFGSARGVSQKLKKDKKENHQALDG